MIWKLADMAQANLPFFDTSDTSCVRESWGAGLGSELTPGRYLMLSIVYLWLIFEKRLSVQILWIRHWLGSIRRDKLKVMVSEHFSICCVIINSCFHVVFGDIYWHCCLILSRKIFKRARCLPDSAYSSTSIGIRSIFIDFRECVIPDKIVLLLDFFISSSSLAVHLPCFPGSKER